jgi:hypothetical protein
LENSELTHPTEKTGYKSKNIQKIKLRKQKKVMPRKDRYYLSVLDFLEEFA